jgi:hypothetical protein
VMNTLSSQAPESLRRSPSRHRQRHNVRQSLRDPVDVSAAADE